MRRRAEKAYLKGNKFSDDARSGYDPIRVSLNYNVNQRQDIFATPDKKKRDILMPRLPEYLKTILSYAKVN